MPELIDPREEKACQLRASGKTQVDAYYEVFDGPRESNNSSRFFRKDYIKIRVAEIKRRRATLADLDDAWVLKRLKRVADANLDDYFARNPQNQRVAIDLTEVDREQMANLQEVSVDEFIDGPRDDPDRIRRTKLKLEPRLPALKMIGDWLGMWAPTKIAPTNPEGDAPYDPLEVNDEQRVAAIEAFLARVKVKTEAA
jgi:Terminase small subunit